MAPCSTALKYFQYPAGEWDSSSCLLSSFRSCRSYSSFHSLPPHPSSSSLSLSIRLSIYPCRSRLFFAVASSQSSFMPLGGEDLITHSEWILPVLPVLKVRAAAWNSRCLTLLDTSLFFIILFYFDHLLSFLKSLFTRHASKVVKKKKKTTARKSYD